ncbi:MAG: MgtC/SapB family protein [Candidatus Omnitrophica bacterium]|nr:MgtC/SapB family protein [Candidatus Omnitrophota bacterium]MDD5592582.1 MgtC/SapB family protein [Candidatus Omnitrophota bacterium]
MVSNMQVVIRLVLSVILGGFIGLERQMHRRNAGLRTHILVSLGSCLIMLTSIYIFAIYKNEAPVDPARIAAGVITGIGFLGAGTIIRDRAGVKGLTTAASLWVVAGIGLSTGCGLYSAAVVTTLLALMTLFFLRHIEDMMFGKEEHVQ